MKHSIAGPSGNLEAQLWLPADDAAPRAVCAFCHPHPQGGGSMDSTVVFRASSGLRTAGVAVVRFNFRGIGASEGVSLGEEGAAGEEGDLSAVLDWLGSRFPGLPLWAGGFSFGSRISAGLALRQPRIQRLVLVATPVLAYPCEALAQLRTPGYLLMAGQDEFGTLAAVKSSFPKLATVLEMDEIAGAEHFFAGHVRELETKIETWARRELDD
jgi:hypothetical protein